MKQQKISLLIFLSVFILVSGAESPVVAPNQSEMLSPRLLAGRENFKLVYQEAEESLLKEDLSREQEYLRDNLGIFFDISQRVKEKLLKKSLKFIPQDQKSIIRWFFHPHAGLDKLPDPNHLKKLISNLVVMLNHGNREIKRQAQVWMPLFAERFGIEEKNFYSLLEWFGQNIKDIDGVEDAVIKDFFEEYLTQYHTNDLLRNRFIYFVNPQLDDNQKVLTAVTNMRKMTTFWGQKFNQGELILKSYLPDSDYFLGVRFGCLATGGTFVIEFLLGQEQRRTDPLSGKFFRLAFDTEGAASIRVNQIGGLRNRKDLIDKFTIDFGISPDKVLLLALLEFAKTHGYENMIALRSHYLANHKNISLPYMAIYKSFGITRNHPLGAMRPLHGNEGLIARWERKSDRNKALLKGMNLIKSAVHELKDIPVIISKKNSAGSEAGATATDSVVCVEEYIDAQEPELFLSAI